MRKLIHISHILTFLLLAILLFIPIDHTFSQKDTIDLLDLSLSELMNIEVVVASKTKESVYDAPGIITVISKKEINSFAETNLGEILNRVVSTSFLSANILQNNLVDFRAQSFTPYNNHTLFLLNGRPIRDPITGGLNATILNSFPVNMIERIEIIRGPGSVLYGSCAYSGVVNIITTTLEENRISVNSEFRLGSQNTQEFNASIFIKNEELSANIGITNLKSDGEFFEFTDYSGVDSSANFWHRNLGLFANFSYNNINFSSAIIDYRPYSLGGVNNSWSEDWGDKEQHISYFNDIGYLFEFNKDHHLELNVTNNRHIWHTDYGKIMEAEDIISEIIWKYSAIKNLNILIGNTMSAESHSSDYFFDGNTRSGNIYLQSDFRLNERIKLIGGIQYNKIQNVKSNISPRIGIIANLNDHIGIKILYGEAFRKGYPLETSFNIVQLLGNPNLKPEIIKTFESQYYVRYEKFQMALTAYYSYMSDIIYREIYDPVTTYLQYANGPTHDFWGFELEGKISPNNNLLFIYSANYQGNMNVNDVRNGTLHPNLMLKGGFIYSTEGFDIGIYNSYFGKPSSVSIVNPDVRNLNPDPTAYNLLSAKISYDLSKTLVKNFKYRTVIAIEGQNILGEDIRYPEFTSKGLNSLMPLRTERTIMASLSFHLK